MPQNHWSIETDGSGGGIVKHDGPPRFTAHWTTGTDPDELAGIDGPYWSDEGSGSGDDSIHIYGFQWRDAAPAQGDFETLMAQAAAAIDRWIAATL